MATPVLMVLTTLSWFGAARIPRALAKAGFEVTLLTPPGSLAEKSAFISKVAHIPDNATPMQWVHAFAATVKGTSARLVVPCDGRAFRMLQRLALAPLEGLRPEIHRELATLISDSLGDPAYYRTSVDKTLLSAAAEALGIRVPAYASVGDAAAAAAFGTAHGYPITLKRPDTGTGDSVAIVPREADVASAFASLARMTPADVNAAHDEPLLAEASVRGHTKYYQASAWKGALLAGFAGEKLNATGDPTAPATVNRYHRSDALRDVAARLARGFGLTGFFALQGVVDERSGEYYLTEINRRLVGGVHRGSDFNVDHCAALHAALHGLPSPTRADLDPGEEHLSVHFPQEWLRDQDSEWLRNYPVDVPWDDPELFEAMLALLPTS
ncbi:MAG: hypothetical protein ACREYB_11530 [Casimicrobiaceae bacterium]